MRQGLRGHRLRGQAALKRRSIELFQCGRSHRADPRLAVFSPLRLSVRHWLKDYELQWHVPPIAPYLDPSQCGSISLWPSRRPGRMRMICEVSFLERLRNHEAAWPPSAQLCLRLLAPSGLEHFATPAGCGKDHVTRHRSYQRSMGAASAQCLRLAQNWKQGSSH